MGQVVRRGVGLALLAGTAYVSWDAVGDGVLYSITKR